jgi:hypothetical protein
MKKFKMKCDICGVKRIYSEKRFFHFTMVLDGELNPHTHVCAECMIKLKLRIPIINRNEIHSKD